MAQYNETISVVIPAYNVQKYLSACLDSVINQTYHNLEIIVINDGSTDSTGTICDDYARKDTRIKVIHQENQGLSGARNTGLNNCTGDYIFFLDSDDYLNSNALLLLYQALNSTHADLAIGNYCYVSEDGSKITPAKPFSCPIYPESVKEYSIWKSAIVQYIAITVVWTKLYRRSLWINDGNTLYFPLGKLHEDTYVLPFILKQCQKIICINDTIVYYRQSTNSIMHQQLSIKNISWCEHHYNIINYLNDKGYYDIATWYFKETARVCIHLYDSFKGNSENIYYLKKYINKQKKLALSLMIRHYSISAKIVFVLFLSSFHLYKVIYKLKK